MNDQRGTKAGIVEKNENVTFFVLHEKDGIFRKSESLLLRGFSTDFYHQGKGYAKKSLMLLPGFIHNECSYIDEIVLVNVKNKTAQSLYKKCGYVDEGARKMGRRGELIIMSYYF